MGIVTFLIVASWLYLEVNGWHIGAWCSSVDNCSLAPDLTGIALAAAVSGLVLVAGVILVGEALQRRRGPTG